VAAEGTDPARLARAVAVAVTSGGTARLDRALAAGSDLPAGDGRRAATAARSWAGRGVSVALRGDPAWPLLRCGTPPPLLAWRGVPPAELLRRPAAALVGARAATGYGRAVAAWLAEAVGAAGGVVVSGGALGIDAAAHEAAVGGGTLVVLGCGHGVAYPRAHAAPGGLFDRVVEAGGTVLSERLPDGVAHAGAVRARNRLVAGLADAVVVVEGGARSGSLLTAGAAADVGVPVMAVPGDVRRDGSVAPHRLLAEGAAPCTSPADLLAALGTSQPQAPQDTGRTSLAGLLPDPLLRALADAWPRPLPVGTLVARSGLAVGPVLAALTRATVAGVLVEAAEGVRLRRAP